jgi:hypothetical protein
MSCHAMRKIRPTTPTARGRSPRIQSSISKTRHNKGIRGNGNTEQRVSACFVVLVCGTHTNSVPDAVVARRITRPKAIDAIRRRRRACARNVRTALVLAVRVGRAGIRGPRAHLRGHEQDQQETVRARGSHLLLHCICAVQHHQCRDIRASCSAQQRTGSAVARGTRGSKMIRSGSASLHYGCCKKCVPIHFTLPRLHWSESRSLHRHGRKQT